MTHSPPDAGFAARVLDWHATHGRHDLPWQRPRTAYRVWVSEIMLQQTQVATALPYFQRFIARFADVASLAEAPLDEVLRLWAGLGYYARARNLHRCAGLIVSEHGGRFPATLAGLIALPGIGRSTAGAILAQAFGGRAAILDGNVRRLLARHAGVDGWPGTPAVQARLWQEAEARLPHTDLADYTQGLMDLGHGVCTPRAPRCEPCPLRDDCVARLQHRTDVLPAPRPRRLRPRRAASALLLHDGRGRLWLQRRPPSGLWGGLWCLPLSEMDQPAATFLQQRGIAQDRARALPRLHHAFTHFDLDLQPLAAGPEALNTAVGESQDGAWIMLDDPRHWPGMPAPIQRLLERCSADLSKTLPADPAENENPS